jgi:uncharacterized membrane protein YoaK (UPF0700 family)
MASARRPVRAHSEDCVGVGRIALFGVSLSLTAWSSFAHGAVMGTQALRNMISRGELLGVAMLVVIGVALIALAPAKQHV